MQIFTEEHGNIYHDSVKLGLWHSDMIMLDIIHYMVYTWYIHCSRSWLCSVFMMGYRYIYSKYLFTKVDVKGK